MKRVLFLLRLVYWGIIAYLPVVLQNQYMDFVLWSIENPKAECLKTGVPFVMHIQLLSWALMILLWPLVLWNLGGRLLWERFKLRKQAATETGFKDA
jgi:hypothetical protein